MKKEGVIKEVKYKILITLLIITTLTGCEYKVPDAKTFTIPENDHPPISGLYQVKKKINLETGEVLSEEWEEYAAFHEHLIVILDDLAEKPRLRLRKASLNDYLMRNFAKSEEFLGLDLKDCLILTVYGENKMPYEVILLDDNEIIFFQNGDFLFLNKIEDSVSESEARNIAKIPTEPPPPKELKKTGVFIGIRYPKDDEIKYETNFFYFENGVMKKALRDEDLFLSSSYRYFRVVPKETNIEEGEIKRLTFATEPISRTIEDDKMPEGSVLLPIEDRIDYLGRDYISIERTHLTENKKTLKVFNINTLDSQVPMSIYDLFYKNIRELLYSSGYSDIEGRIDEENFGIRRIDGRWRLVVRVEIEEGFNDYVIDANIPERIVSREVDILSKEALLSHFPDLIDSYSSKDIILVESANAIRGYALENNQLIPNPNMQWNLPEGANVIMIEWMEGIRADEAYSKFLQNGGKKIEGVDR